MTFTFVPDLLYRMPVHFGGTPGPRQGPDGRPFDWSDQPLRTLLLVSFLSDEEKLGAMLPPGFKLLGDPVVTVEVQYWRRLAWLAGRGYNTLGVKIPASYKSARETVTGHFLAVIWETMPDAILSGREELGYNKIFASIDEPRVQGADWACQASWFGHKFLEMGLANLQDADKEAIPSTPGDGILHFKYIPGTGESSVPDAAYATLTPLGGQLRVTSVKTGTGHVRFLPTRWEDMPTQYHIVSALAELPQHKTLRSVLVESVGARDLSDQRRLG